LFSPEFVQGRTTDVEEEDGSNRQTDHVIFPFRAKSIPRKKIQNMPTTAMLYHHFFSLFACRDFSSYSKYQVEKWCLKDKKG
jgi:hypothetical protein